MAMAAAWDRLYPYCGTRIANALFRRPIAINSSRPIISFTFDDFPRSALWTGGAILNQFGVSGTYYASLGLMGKVAPTGHMFEREDLFEVVQQGHELGCHTFAHCDTWSTRSSEFEQSILENSRALKSLLPGVALRTMSYPISLPGPVTKMRTARHFECCRGGGQRFNHGIADLNQLSAYFLEKSRDRIDAVKDIIDRNCRSNGWLILATHDVSENPTRFGCVPGFFEEVVRHSVDCGASILPVARALAVLRGPGLVRD